VPLPQSLLDRDVDERRRCRDDVECRVGELGQRGGIALNELDGGEIGGGRFGARFGKHALRDVDTDDPAVISDLPGRMQGRESGAGAGVEHTIAGLQPGEVHQPSGRGAVPVAGSIATRTVVEGCRDLFVPVVHGSVSRRADSDSGWASYRGRCPGAPLPVERHHDEGARLPGG
jgi:hypothetical protein